MTVTTTPQTNLFLLLVLLAAGCSNRADDCEVNLSCAPNGGSSSKGGTSKGGTTSDGGTEAGGTTNAGGTTSTGGAGGTSAGGTTATTTTRPPCNGMCGGSTSVCDIPTDKCVECLKKTDCTTSTKPVCTASNTCVECSGNADCKDSTKPVCNSVSNACVGCLASTDCKDAAKPVCNTATNACVACLGNADCKDPTASLCNTSTNTCSPCSVDADCSQISVKGVCSAGTCVQCTVANETACGANSCNPATKGCTTTAKWSRVTCQSCVADSECGDGSGTASPSFRCIPMTFGPSAAAHGAYCLQKVTNGCSSPYAVSFSAISLSGAAIEAYCGINQSATTCEAVLDLASAKTCSLDGDCGGGQGGLCKAISVVAPANRCTIPCGSTAECLSSGPGSTCSNTVNGYCK